METKYAKLVFNYGAMGSGKSAALLQVAHNYEQKGMYILVVKPAIDTKGENDIVSRIGIKRTADVVLRPNDDLLGKMPAVRPAAIIVDEAQFLSPKQVDELYYITKTFGIPVLCYGLRADFQMKGFPGSIRLLEISDEIRELKTMSEKYETYKTRKDIEGEPCLGGGWFSVSIVLPVGVLKHYFSDFYWDLFDCKEVEKEYEIYADTRDDLKEKIITFVKGETLNERASNE